MICCIVVAAGRGKRFKSRIPKTLFMMRGIPVVEYCLRTFSASSLVDEVILVMQKKFINTSQVSAWKKSYNKLVKVVPGGKYREQSVLNGLLHCSKKCNIILVHDGARPFVSENLINRVIRATARYGACIPVWSVNGSVKSVKKDRIVSTISQGTLHIAQTPQGFRKEIIEKAFEFNKNHLKDFPDEASLCMKAGFGVHVVPGEVINIKITTKEDLQLAFAICGSSIT